MRKVTLHDCSGCRDDFYNYNRMGLNESGGVPRCGSFENAKLVKARDVPVDLRPPYRHIPLTERPDCYRGKGVVRVKPEALDERGFWK